MEGLLTDVMNGMPGKEGNGGNSYHFAITEIGEENYKSMSLRVVFVAEPGILLLLSNLR